MTRPRSRLGAGSHQRDASTTTVCARLRGDDLVGDNTVKARAFRR